MTNNSLVSNTLPRIIALISAASCVVLGIIALYSSGIGLLDPKLHRAFGFGLALIVGIAASQVQREKPSVPLFLIDFALLIGGIWSIWSFLFVQTQMEEALYDVTITDAWPALVGLIVFLELCRRLWGWGLFSVGVLAVLYLLFGEDMPGLLAHSGFSLTEVAEALWYNTNKGVFGSITNIVLSTVSIFIIFGVLLEGTGAGDTLLKQQA